MEKTGIKLANECDYLNFKKIEWWDLRSCSNIKDEGLKYLGFI